MSPMHSGKANGISALSFKLGQAKRHNRHAITITVEDAELIVNQTREILRREYVKLAMQRSRLNRTKNPKKLIAINQPGSILAPHQVIKPTLK